MKSLMTNRWIALAALMGLSACVDEVDAQGDMTTTELMVVATSDVEQIRVTVMEYDPAYPIVGDPIDLCGGTAPTCEPPPPNEDDGGIAVTHITRHANFLLRRGDTYVFRLEAYGSDRFLGSAERIVDLYEARVNVTMVLDLNAFGGAGPSVVGTTGITNNGAELGDGEGDPGVAIETFFPAEGAAQVLQVTSANDFDGDPVMVGTIAEATLTDADYYDEPPPFFGGGENTALSFTYPTSDDTLYSHYLCAVDAPTGVLVGTHQGQCVEVISDVNDSSIAIETWQVAALLELNPNSPRPYDTIILHGWGGVRLLIDSNMDGSADNRIDFPLYSYLAGWQMYGSGYLRVRVVDGSTGEISVVDVVGHASGVNTYGPYSEF